MVVKLKIFKVSCIDSASMKWLHIVRRILQNFEIWLKWNALKFYGFGLFWGSIFSWKTKNIAKNQKSWKNCMLRNIK